MRWEIRCSRSAGMAVQLRRNTHIVAVITDYVFGSDTAVDYSLAVVAMTTIPLGIVSLYVGLHAGPDTAKAARPVTIN